MYGVEGSVASIKILSNALGKGVEKKLLQKALTKLDNRNQVKI